MMRWLLSFLILAGAISAVPEEMLRPLHYAHDVHLFHDNYQLDEDGGSTTTTSTTLSTTTTTSSTMETTSSPTTTVSTITTTVEPAGCFSPFMDIEGRCLYYNTHDTKNWTYAQKACEAINGNLIEIPKEQQDPLSESLHNITVGSYILGGFWTGGSDKQEEDDWVWLNDNPVEGDWGNDENINTTGINENCLLLNTNEAVYMDQQCKFTWPYLCEPGPCYNKTCGIKAHCVVVDYVTSNCTCNEGYEGDADSECTEINPCDKADCGDHAECIPDSWNTHHCNCEEGYLGNPPEIPCADPCDKADCGDHAKCIADSWNTHHCNCEEGYLGNPPEIPCEYDPCYNITCGDHANCEKLSNSTAECQCNDGYTGDDPDKGCTLIDYCAGVTCGEHAKCEPNIDEHKGECHCDPKYPNGDPLVKCSGGDPSVSCNWPMLLLTLSVTILLGHRNES